MKRKTQCFRLVALVSHHRWNRRGNWQANLSFSNGDDHNGRPFTARWAFPTIISIVFTFMVILKITIDVLPLRHIQRTRSEAHHDIEQGQPRNTSPRQQRRSLKRTLKQYESSEERRVGDECAICLEDLKDGDWCRVLYKCNHRYHRDCIDMWLSKDIHCPLCRDSVHGGSNRGAPANNT